MKVSMERVLTGVGMTLAASVLLPMLKSVAKPVVSGSLIGTTLAANGARKNLSMIREEMEDFMAEVAYERENPTTRR